MRRESLRVADTSARQSSFAHPAGKHADLEADRNGFSYTVEGLPPQSLKLRQLFLFLQRIVKTEATRSRCIRLKATG